VKNKQTKRNNKRCDHLVARRKTGHNMWECRCGATIVHLEEM
jgi:hypothetical protein